MRLVLRHKGHVLLCLLTYGEQWLRCKAALVLTPHGKSASIS